MLADRIKERDPGNAPASGDRISFLYILPPAGQSASKLQGDRIETPTWIKEKGLKIDARYYMEHQLMNPLAQLFALVVDELPGCSRTVDPETAATDYLFRDALNICSNQNSIKKMFGSITVIPKLKAQPVKDTVAERTRSKAPKLQTKLFAQQMILKAMERPKSKETKPV